MSSPNKKMSWIDLGISTVALSASSFALAYGVSSALDHKKTRDLRRRMANGLKSLAKPARLSRAGSFGEEDLLRDVREIFSDIDKDNNGSVSLEELRTYVQKWASARLVDPLADERLKALGISANFVNPLKEIEEAFRKIDLSENGSLSMSEFVMAFILNVQVASRDHGIRTLYDDIASKSSSLKNKHGVKLSELLSALADQETSDGDNSDNVNSKKRDSLLWNLKASQRLRELDIAIPSPLTYKQAEAFLHAV